MITENNNNMHILLDFLNEWLEQKEWWFSCDPAIDIIVLNKFEYLLDVVFTKQDFENVLVKAAAVVLYDQVPRHTRDPRIIAEHASLALTMSWELINSGDIQYVVGDMLCFVLLPLRHSKISQNIRQATHIMWTRIEEHPQSYRRFLKAAYERWEPLEVGGFVALETTHYDDDVGKFVGILDYCCRTPVRTNLMNRDDIIVQSFKAWTASYDKIVISLSGGVDSMVCSYIAVALWGHKRCVFLHVNYMNRATSLEEEEFVQWWSKKMGVRLYVRRIDEIHRPTCMKYDMREVYETYTKRVRFACYRDVDASAVILGHNKDDAFENIMTNISGQCHMENLEGMTQEVVQDGVRLVRPFLAVSKASIIEFAHQNGISFLYDSTPSWSQRGKIRDSVVPCLNKWDPMFIRGMFNLARDVKDMHDQMAALVRNIGDTWNELPTSVVIWRMMIKQRGFRQPSQKSLESMIAALNTCGKNGGRRFELSKSLHVIIKRVADEKEKYLVKFVSTII